VVDHERWEELKTYTLQEIHADDELEANQFREWFAFFKFRADANKELNYAFDGKCYRNVLDEKDLAQVSILAPRQFRSGCLHTHMFANRGL
jgi:hypothetical protein